MGIARGRGEQLHRLAWLDEDLSSSSTDDAQRHNRSLLGQGAVLGRRVGKPIKGIKGESKTVYFLNNSYPQSRQSADCPTCNEQGPF